MGKIDWRKLREPFPAEGIEWRIQSSGMSRGGKPWARVLAYVTSRHVMDRLDDVFGPDGWANEFRTGPDGGVLCGLSVRTDDGTWVTKWDGASNTDIESVKGGLSAAMKRAAVQLGIGRYLYGLGESWANFHDGGSHFVKIEKQGYRWDPPSLPGWALPEGASQKATQPPQRTKGKPKGESPRKQEKSDTEATEPSQKELLGTTLESLRALLDEARTKDELERHRIFVRRWCQARKPGSKDRAAGVEAFETAEERVRQQEQAA